MGGELCSGNVPLPWQKMSSGRFAVIVESSCFREPAVALRGLAKTGAPSSSRSRFIS